MGSKECCIYKVPSQLREVKPAAYTPRILLIGPLHHFAKPKVFERDIEANSLMEDLKNGNSRSLEYLMMEEQKKRYMNDFNERFHVEEMMKGIIEDSLNDIRASYAVSTEWISPADFKELILRDSVFILELCLRHNEKRKNTNKSAGKSKGKGKEEEEAIEPKNKKKILHQKKEKEEIAPKNEIEEEEEEMAPKKEKQEIAPKNEIEEIEEEEEMAPKKEKEECSHPDLTVDNGFYTSMVIVDLMLLENQLPYFILEKLFDCIQRHRLVGATPLYELILHLFSLTAKIDSNEKFKHFTDMYRCVYEKSLGNNPRGSKRVTEDIYNADRLSRSGVKFNTVGGDFSLAISFNKGVLSMPCFPADESSDVILRNVIAYEQCHDPRNAFTSEYIDLMNFLVTTNKDVEILTTSGAISNDIGRPSLVVEMINKLGEGVLTPIDTVYHDTVRELNTHCNSCGNNCCATLKRVYFSDLWTGTATAVAGLLLFLTLAATIASIYQAVKAK